MIKIRWRTRRAYLTLVLCMLCSWIGCVSYLFFHTPQYGSQATLLFHDGSDANVANGDLLLREVVGSRELNALNPDHEQQILANSYTFFHSAVERTRANVSCYLYTLSGKRYLDTDAPVHLRSWSLRGDTPLSFRVKAWDERGFRIEGAGWSERGTWNEPVVSPQGDSLVFEPGGDPALWQGKTLRFRIDDPHRTAILFRHRMSIRQQVSPQIQTVSLLAPHPDLSKRFLQALIDSYVEHHIATATASLDSARLLLDRQVASVERELRGMEQLEWGYKRERRATNIEAQEQLHTSILIGMERRREEVEERQHQLALFLEMLGDEGDLPRALPLLPGADLLGINADIRTYNRERDLLYRLQRHSSEDHPRVTVLEAALRKRLDSVRSRMADLRRAAICEAQVIDRRREAGREEMRSIASTLSGVAPLVRERRIKGSLYSYLSYKREENDLLRTQVLPPVRLLDPIQQGGMHSFSVRQLLGYGSLGAFGGWLALLMIPAFFDFRVHSTAAVRRLVPVPVLGGVPQIQDPGLQRDGFAGLVYEVMRELPEAGRMLCVTSSSPGEGKTFLSVNLARSLAALGKRVCLVGLDLRRPVMQTHFGLGGERGVSDWLSPAVFPEIASQDIEKLFFTPENDPGLTILPAGTIPPNPAELLQSERFGRLLEQLRERFDMVVLDTPPAEVVTDTVLVSQYVDLSLYIVRVGYTDRRMLAGIGELAESGRLRKMRVVVNCSLSPGDPRTRVCL